MLVLVSLIVSLFFLFGGRMRTYHITVIPFPFSFSFIKGDAIYYKSHKHLNTTKDVSAERETLNVKDNKL